MMVLVMITVWSVDSIGLQVIARVLHLLIKKFKLKREGHIEPDLVLKHIQDALFVCVCVCGVAGVEEELMV